jgi:hypothetical protein
MRNVFMSVAMFVVVGTSPSLDALAADASGGIDPVVIEKVSERRFRLVNNSDETLTYMHWINQAVNPVPYCKYPDDSIAICSRDTYLDSNRKPALQEARLAPGKSIHFDAMKSKAVAVGVRLKINGEQRLLWCEL